MTDQGEPTADGHPSTGVDSRRALFALVSAAVAVVVVIVVAALGGSSGEEIPTDESRSDAARRDTTARPSVSTPPDPDSTTPPPDPSASTQAAHGAVVNPAWAAGWAGPQLGGPTALPSVDRPQVDQYVLESLAVGDSPGGLQPDDQPYGAGCSPGPGRLPDGIWAAGLVGADRSSIEVDLVCLYPQQPGMWERPNGDACVGPFDSGDPCMTNESGTVRRLELSPSTEIAIPRVIRPGAQQPTDEVQSVDLAPSTVDELLTYLAAGTVNPFWIRVESGAVTRIEEHRNFFREMSAISAGL